MSEGSSHVEGTAGGAANAPVGPTHAAWRPAERIGQAGLGLGVFLLHLLLALRLDRLGAFDRFNTLFGSDPNLRLEALRRSDSSFWLPHPGLSYVLGLPLKGVAKIVAALAPGDPGTAEIGRALALGVAPLAAALQCLVVLHLLRRLGLAFGTAFLLALLSAVSMSAVVFGSVPETYCVSGLAIALGYVLLLRTARAGGGAQELQWLGVGVLTAAVTITNVAAIAVLYAARAIRRTGRPGAAIARAAGMAALAVAVAAAGGLVASKVVGVRHGQATSERAWIERYFVEDPVAHLATFPTAVVNGIAPPTPDLLPNFAVRRPGSAQGEGGPSEADAGARQAPGRNLPRDALRMAGGRLFRVTLQPSHHTLSVRNLVGVALLSALAWAAIRRRGADPLLRLVCLASLTIVAVNWVFHGFWGGEAFLYSQHWHVPLIVLAAASAAAGRRRPRLTMAALAVTVAAVTVSNLVVLARMLSMLGG